MHIEMDETQRAVVDAAAKLIADNSLTRVWTGRSVPVRNAAGIDRPR